jgi:hypothetical protein
MSLERNIAICFAGILAVSASGFMLGETYSSIVRTNDNSRDREFKRKMTYIRAKFIMNDPILFKQIILNDKHWHL